MAQASGNQSAAREPPPPKIILAYPGVASAKEGGRKRDSPWSLSVLRLAWTWHLSAARQPASPSPSRLLPRAMPRWLAATDGCLSTLHSENILCRLWLIGRVFLYGRGRCRCLYMAFFTASWIMAIDCLRMSAFLRNRLR